MKQTVATPFYILDEHISYKFADVFRALGYNMTSVQEAFSGRRAVPDEDIIEWLGNRGRQNAVWITEDWEATKTHAKLILAKQISVLWIREPKREALTGLQELQLLSLIIQWVTDLVESTDTPIYLKASLHGRKPKLEKLISHLLASQFDWKRIILQ